MNSYNPSTLISNIITNAQFLHNDFIDITVNFSGILLFILNISFVFLLIIILYFIGKKIYLFFFDREEFLELKSFLYIAFGYITVGTGIAVLGVFSLLYREVIYVYLLAVIVMAFYPYINIKGDIKEICKLTAGISLCLKTNKWVLIGILLFILIAFLRLIPPETGEDAIGYHTSLPNFYLKQHSILAISEYKNITFPIPQLGEMLYVITQSLGLKDASRYVHFMFYVLFIILMSSLKLNDKKRENGTGLYASLLFITAPVVIQVSSKANADFQWLFLWILSIFLITKKEITSRSIILSAVFFGGVLATKIWAIAFLPIFIIFLLIIIKKKREVIKKGMLFLFFSFTIPMLWYIRAYLVTGNPFYPGFSGSGDVSEKISFFANIGFNKSLFDYSTLVAFSPLFFFGIFIFIYKFNLAKKIFNLKIFLFFCLLFIEHLFLPRYGFPRYLMSIYSFAVILIAMQVNFIKVNINLKIIFYFTFSILSFYYIINTILVLPYGLGWADENKYLTRILSRDNSSYYDFDHLFSKWISDKDLVATYGINGYYYANFLYIDSSAYFNKKNKSFDLLKKRNVSRLFIQGGDLKWYCRKLELRDCSEKKVKLLATYPPGFKKYNLYFIK